MSYMTFPLNNVNYSAEDMEAFMCTRRSGVYSDGDFCPTCIGNNNIVTISPGIAWINNEPYSGKVFKSDSNVNVELELANVALPRIDAIFIRFSKIANATTIVAKTGEASSNPQPPETIKNTSVYELCIAKIYRPAGAEAVISANITDTRLDPAVCGLMGDSVTSIDTMAIYSQMQSLTGMYIDAIEHISSGDLSDLEERIMASIPHTVNVVESGNGNPVSSDAVFNAIAAIQNGNGVAY